MTNAHRLVTVDTDANQYHEITRSPAIYRIRYGRVTTMWPIVYSRAPCEQPSSEIVSENERALVVSVLCACKQNFVATCSSLLEKFIIFVNFRLFVTVHPLQTVVSRLFSATFDSNSELFISLFLLFSISYLNGK